jgi:predicted acylesterase/phospholipase RssA
MKKMALVLQGGGALGAFEYGVVTKLIEMEWQPVAVTGVSIGAVNAAAIAGAKGGDIVASLHTMWGALTMPQVPWLPESMQKNLSLLGNPNFWRSRTDYLEMPSWTSLCTTAPMYQTLADNLDFAQINNPKHIRLGVTATSLHTGGPTTFSNFLAPEYHSDNDHHTAVQTEILPMHIMASGALPPGFPAVKIDERYFWDGGLFSNTPIDALLNLLDQHEIETLPIFVIDLFPTQGLPEPANLSEVQTRALAMQYQNRFWAEFGGSADVAGFVSMLEQMDKEISPKSDLRLNPAYEWLQRLRALKNINVIQSGQAAGGGDHDFSEYGIRTAYEAGRTAVANYFAQLQEKRPRLRTSKELDAA